MVYIYAKCYGEGREKLEVWAIHSSSSGNHVLCGEFGAAVGRGVVVRGER